MMYGGVNSTKAEEVFKFHCLIPLIRSWLMPGRASGHQKLARVSMDLDICLTGLLVVHITVVKCHQRLGQYIQL